MGRLCATRTPSFRSTASSRNAGRSSRSVPERGVASAGDAVAERHDRKRPAFADVARRRRRLRLAGRIPRPRLFGRSAVRADFHPLSDPDDAFGHRRRSGAGGAVSGDLAASRRDRPQDVRAAVCGDGHAYLFASVPVGGRGQQDRREGGSRRRRCGVLAEYSGLPVQYRPRGERLDRLHQLASRTAGKRTVLLQWSGDCQPPGIVVRKVYEAGVYNFNGGDTVITKSAPSWTNIAPIGVDKGPGAYQVYAPNQDENVYTNDWQGPFYGFTRVLETFDMTDRPRRFKPIDIYYHMYSGTKVASLRALDQIFSTVLKQPVLPVHVTDYIRKVLDWRLRLQGGASGAAQPRRLAGARQRRSARAALAQQQHADAGSLGCRDRSRLVRTGRISISTAALRGFLRAEWRNATLRRTAVHRRGERFRAQLSPHAQAAWLPVRRLLSAVCPLANAQTQREVNGKPVPTRATVRCCASIPPRVPPASGLSTRRGRLCSLSPSHRFHVARAAAGGRRGADVLCDVSAWRVAQRMTAAAEPSDLSMAYLEAWLRVQPDNAELLSSWARSTPTWPRRRRRTHRAAHGRATDATASRRPSCCA